MHYCHGQLSQYFVAQLARQRGLAANLDYLLRSAITPIITKNRARPIQKALLPLGGLLIRKTPQDKVRKRTHSKQWKSKLWRNILEYSATVLRQKHNYTLFLF